MVEEAALTYLLEGGVPSKLRARCSGSYLMFAASAGSFFTKSVSSRSWISRATGALVEACRRHWRLEVCERAEFWVRRRLKNEAVTSCRAMLVEVVWMDSAWPGCASLDRFTSPGMRASLGLSRRGSAEAESGCCLRQPWPITADLPARH